MVVNVIQVGKGRRDTTGTILRRRSNQIQIEFVVSVFEEDDDYLPVTVIRWFKRRSRNKGGMYECYDMDYRYYTDQSLRVGKL